MPARIYDLAEERRKREVCGPSPADFVLLFSVCFLPLNLAMIAVMSAAEVMLNVGR